jgi:hypothetical protein
MPAVVVVAGEVRGLRGLLELQLWGRLARRRSGDDMSDVLELREPRMSWVWSGEHDNEAGARATYALVAAKVG